MALSVEQLEQRRGKITASILSDIVGVNPWRGPLAAWLRIMGRHIEDEQHADDPREWGQRVEQNILDWYAQTRGVEIAYFGTIEHPDHPWLLATPDACVFGERTVVEAKNVNARVAAKWDAGVPVYVVVQAITQMEVCDAERCDVVASIAGRPPQIFRLKRDREEGRALIAFAQEWYRDHVLANDPPPPDETTTTKEIEGVFPDHTDEIVEVAGDDERLRELFVEYRLARELEKLAVEAKKQLAAWICRFIGQRRGLELEMDGERYRATWTHRDAVRVESFTRPAGRAFDLRAVKTTKTNTGTRRSAA